MRSLSLEIELAPRRRTAPAMAARVAQQLREALGLTVPVHVVRGGHAAAVRDEGPAVRRGGVSERDGHDAICVTSPDVVVIGGGPAGSTVSTLLAQQGCRVELFERERFPRFHIGESLIPETYWVLKRLNMLPKMQQSHFVKKYSVQFVNSNGKLSAPFYFWDNKPHECSQTWQVVRSEFDQMMLDNAREHGVDVHEGVRVHRRAVRRRPRRRRDDQGRGRLVPRGAREGRRRRQRPERPDHEPAAACASGIPCSTRARSGPTGKAPIATPAATRARRMVIQTGNKNGWFWYIPLHDNIVSVGVVAPFDYLFKGRGPTTSRPTTRKSTGCPAVKERVAERDARHRATSRPRTTRTASKQVAGDGWVLVGDAFGFLDPLYSSGVLLALKSGELAADAIVEGLDEGRHLGGAARQVGRRRSTRASIACGGWSASTTTASASATFVQQLSATCRARVTDLLIGDLFDRHGGQGVGADGVALSAGQAADSVVERRHAAGWRRDKANELMLPEGRRP